MSGIIAAIAAWAWDNKLASGLLVLLVAACGYGATQTLRLAAAGATIERQKVNIATLETANASNQIEIARFSNLLEEQKASIAGYVAAAAKEQEKADAAGKRIERMRREHAQELADILNRPVPTGCEESVIWLGQQANEIMEAWQ